MRFWSQRDSALRSLVLQAPFGRGGRGIVQNGDSATIIGNVIGNRKKTRFATTVWVNRRFAFYRRAPLPATALAYALKAVTTLVSNITAQNSGDGSD